MTVVVERFDTEGPADTAGLEVALARIGRDRIHKLALFVKVEGEAGDRLRERAHSAFDIHLARAGLATRAQLLIAQGCEGVAAPFGYLIAEVRAKDIVAGTRANMPPVMDPESSGLSPGLALGLARSEPIVEEEAERLGLLSRVGDTVRAAMSDARLTRDQVVMVFVTLPQPRIGADLHEHLLARRVRGLAALSVGVALGEINPSRAIDAVVNNDTSVFARRVQSFASVETTCAEVIVLGNRPGAGGEYIAASAQPADLIDMRSVKRMLVAAGLPLDADGELADPDRVAALFYKAGPSRDGRVRGARSLIYGSNLSPDHHTRAAVSGALAALLGTTRFFNTGDPIHAAPDGGAVACAIVRKH